MERIKKTLKIQIEKLEKELRVDIPKELEKAASLGDLSENAEYQYLKERQFYLSARIAQLKQRLSDISLINIDDIPRDKVGYGSKVYLIELDTNKEVVYKLVFPEESDVGKGLISTASPVGRALMGKEMGEEVVVTVPNGKRSFLIKRIQTIHDLLEEEREEV
ncbi:MAG: transcription elongation factor GreA [Acidobacteriota bacterium]